jgi:hypothetical protein
MNRRICVAPTLCLQALSAIQAAPTSVPIVLARAVKSLLILWDQMSADMVVVDAAAVGDFLFAAELIADYGASPAAVDEGNGLTLLHCGMLDLFAVF